METQAGQILDSSISTATNVEHIFFNLTGTGNYKIVVTNTGGLQDHPSQQYGLAWWWGNGSPPLTGDYNNDGNVDTADYVLWRKDPPSYGGNPAGYDTWRSNFGAGSGNGASLASVPEPPAIGLALVGLLLCGAKRRGA